jgi:hypothetical protein
MRPGKTSLLLLSALLAGAARPSAAAPRLLSPTPGAFIAPGRVARIEIGGAPSGAEEWEAFVSLDGGRTYPLRVTPHLPIAERTFDWTVPALAPGALRVRVRFGTRGIEREFILEDGFEVATGDAGDLLASEAAALGQPPAPGEEQTVAWIDLANGRARLVVPAARPGVASTTRWIAGRRAAVPAPKRKRRFGRSEPGSVSLATRRPAPAPLPPAGRTIASLSRLNV